LIGSWRATGSQALKNDEARILCEPSGPQMRFLKQSTIQSAADSRTHPPVTTTRDVGDF